MVWRRAWCSRWRRITMAKLFLCGPVPAGSADGGGWRNRSRRRGGFAPLSPRSLRQDDLPRLFRRPSGRYRLLVEPRVPKSLELLEDFREYQEKWGQDDLAIIAVNAESGPPGAGSTEGRPRQAQTVWGIIYSVLLDGAERRAGGLWCQRTPHSRGDRRRRPHLLDPARVRADAPCGGVRGASSLLWARPRRGRDLRGGD